VTPLRLTAPRLNHALAATAVVLAGFAAWPWLWPPVPAIRPLAAPHAAATAPALSALPPLATYDAIVERPLFSPSRRAPPGVAAATGPSINSRYRLLGILASGPRRKAFLADGARRIEITEGETLDGWTVKQIAQDRVLLASPAGEAVLKLKPAAVPEAPKQ
jgi:hypothetical protein